MKEEYFTRYVTNSKKLPKNTKYKLFACSANSSIFFCESSITDNDSKHSEHDFSYYTIYLKVLRTPLQYRT